MRERLSKLICEARRRMRSIVLGSTLALATVLFSHFGSSCATTGQ
jgi:hypothetical protein